MSELQKGNQPLKLGLRALDWAQKRKLLPKLKANDKPSSPGVSANLILAKC